MGTNLLIIGGSLVLMGLLGLSPAIRAWWKALLSRPGASLMLIGAMASTLIGGGTGADISNIISDTTRLVRMGVLSLLLLVALLGIFQNTRCWRNAGPGAKLVLLYALFAMSSALYSLSPVLSLYKGTEVLILVLTGIYLAGQQRDRDDLIWLLNITSLIVLFLCATVFMGVIVSPQEAFRAGSFENPDEMTSTVRGVIGSINPSSVGGLGALLLIAALVPAMDKRTRGKAGLWIVAAVAVAVIILAHSRTAIFGASAALVGILVFNRRILLAVAIGAAGTILILLTAIGDYVMQYIYRGQSQELFLSMSGRTHYWGIFFDRFMETPVLGHGFYAGIRVLFSTSSTDNSYLGVMLDLGIVGLILFVMPVLYMILSLWKNRPRRNMPWHGDSLWLQIGGLFVIVLLRSPVSTSFQILHHLLVIYTVLHIAMAAHARLRRDFISEKLTAARGNAAKTTPLRNGHKPNRLRNASLVRR